MYVFFFFKQKTAYESRISDWSSDVCSSDLRPRSALRACPMTARTTFACAAQQLDLFVGTSAAIAARDTQDLMAWPFFNLAKSKRVKPIDFRMGDISILVEATAEHGMATIWDADVLIWVASQIVEARENAGKPTSRLIAATPHEILAFTRRGTGKWRLPIGRAH